MPRPAAHDEAVARALSGGRTASHADLLALGVSRSAVSRLVARGVLARRAHDLYVLSSDWDGDPFPALAARYGGEPSMPFGVLCLQAAAIVHGLTDMGAHNLPEPEVAFPWGSRPGPVEGLRFRPVRLRVPLPQGEMEWRGFGRGGMHVTSPGRTVCDLYAPWAGALPEGLAREALARLLEADPEAASEAAAKAERLGWGRRVAADLEAMRAARRFIPAAGEEDIGGMTL
jgi:hypothetical protein